ncbi:sulfotransferase 6B1 [Dunckerocampus dactyliophorus]|uniref:sulfotransferase 6B1 n=1 Tax=Dunckerocampus dactyliophorus TaxID=161453 RepID=UPI002406FACA|nr:sulfotransferase 6B1 [Dunckerocampus dactyliophorus]
MSAEDFARRLQSRLQQATAMKEEEKLYRYKGVLYPLILCPQENLRAVEAVTARDDDILLVAYPKCGFNWMVGVLNKIITEATGRKIETRVPPLIEFFGPDVLQAIDQSPLLRFLGTHLHPDNIPASFFAKRAKMLVIFRNPKDVLVSFYHFCNNFPVLPSASSWESFYANFLSGDVPWGSYFEHALAWERRMDDPDVMVVTYEQLKQDLGEGVRQMSSFLGFKLTEAQVQRVSESSTFTAMKESLPVPHGMGGVIFRKGEVGDWRNHFTAEQSQQMDKVFSKHLAGTRLGRQLNYDVHCQ